jgi:hypothetical protein
MSRPHRPVRVFRKGTLAILLVALALGTTGCTSRVGIFLPFITGAVGPQEITTEARALGVKTARFSQDVTAPVRPNFAVFDRNGIDLVVDLHNDPQPNANGHNVSHPPDTPEEVATWRQQVATVLDGIPKPVVVQVENEENSTTFFQGQMSDYVNQLNATVEAAHPRGVKVTNGGITSSPTALLTWQDYKDRGLDAQADDFAVRVFSDQPRILNALRAEPFAGLPSASLQAAWDRAEQLIPAYRQSAMDYVNFHWYENDSEALREAIDYLRRATGKPVVTTEIGQHDTPDPAVVTGHLATLVEQLRVPLVLWFDADGIPAVGLHDQPGVLRPNGQAFKFYVAYNDKLID